MAPHFFIVFIILHIFALWPLMLFYCRSKKKRALRKTGQSCESVIGDKTILSQVKTAVPAHRNFKRIVTTPAKVAVPKADKKTEKETTNTEEKKTTDQKTKQTTGENETNEKPPPAPSKEEQPKEVKSKPCDKKTHPKSKEIDKTQLGSDVTQLSHTILDEGCQLEKTQSATEQESIPDE